MLKTGHSPSIFSYIITLRNCFRQKSFPACEKNLSQFIEVQTLPKGLHLYEFGVGYTLTDCLILNYHFHFTNIYLSDLNQILHVRTYALATILNPQNWKSKIFRYYLKSLLFLLVYGRYGLSTIRAIYTTDNKAEKYLNSDTFVYSNAVLEHIHRLEIKPFLENFKLRGLHTFAGIIDTNDHINRNKPMKEQFANFHGSYEEIQFRGNGIFQSEWEKIFIEAGFQGIISPLEVEEKDMAGILYFSLTPSS